MNKETLKAIQALANFDTSEEDKIKIIQDLYGKKEKRFRFKRIKWALKKSYKYYKTSYIKDLMKALIAIFVAIGIVILTILDFIKTLLIIPLGLLFDICIAGLMKKFDRYIEKENE